MRRKAVVLAVAVSVTAGAASSPPASAIHRAKRCGSLAGYKIMARVVGCRFARRWAPRSYYNRRKPSGYRCNYGSSRSRIRMYCFTGGSKAYWLQR
jgi:hypothetical protein